MPKNKRNHEEDLKRCYKKLKRLEKKLKDHGKTQDGEPCEEGGGTSQAPACEAEAAAEPEPTPGTSGNSDNPETPKQINPETDNDSEVIDPEVLVILGDPVKETTKFGPKISDNLANRWTPILRKGLTKDDKENILKIYQVPSNCELLQSPALNPEIGSAISDAAKNRDKKLETAQQQLGVGLTALGRAMSLAITDHQGEKIQIIKHMNDAARILTDLHYNETRARKQLITPTLDKSFLELVKDVDHDDFLYGKNLTDKIKTLKSIERSSQSIKKVDQTKSTTHSYPSSNKIKQGNFNNPPRYQQRFTPAARGTARGGFKRPPLPPRRQAPTPAPTQAKKDSTRAPH